MTAMYDEKLNLGAVTHYLLENLDPRSRDVIARRYGIETGKPETLESIGREYGITRERVRQIQSQAKKNIQAMDSSLAAVADFFALIFKDFGGVLAEEHVVTIVQERLPQATKAQIVIFYLDVLPPYKYVVRHAHFAPYWEQPQLINEATCASIDCAEGILNKAEHPIDEADFMRSIREQLIESDFERPDEHVMAQLIASKNVQKTPFKQWGLAKWAETNPRGVGDKAYVVLRRHGKPAHFTEITSLINEARFDHRRANPQTVHNELIKDSRFVLVGRGLYGLVEWGYIPGTVTDVIESLLKKSAQPLTRDEVVERVLEQRHVKKNTILLGLQNQQRFERMPDSRYRTKVAGNQ